MLTSGAQEVRPTLPIEQLRQRFNRLSGSTRNVHRLEPNSLTHVDVILGSITATWDELAHSLVEKARKRGAEVTFESLHSFDPAQLVDPNSPYRSQSRLVVFVVSTHMAGRPSSNAESFLNWLQQPTRKICTTVTTAQLTPLRESEVEPCVEAPRNCSSSTGRSPRVNRILLLKPEEQNPQHAPTSISKAMNWRHPFGGGDRTTLSGKEDGPLRGVQYTVFGVGNSIYRTFNVTAKYVDARLQELGAARAFPLGLDDTSKWIDVTFAKWENQLLHLIAGPASDSTISSLSTNDSMKSPHISGADKESETNDEVQKVIHDPTSADVDARLAKEPAVPLTRSSGFARLLLRRRSTFDPSPPAIFLPSLPALK